MLKIVNENPESSAITKAPKVSVVIPCYNLGQYLDEAVDSVLSQTFQDLEIIVVNDGSTDEDTNQMLRSYNKPKTKVLWTENQGLPSARNNGIRASQGEYVCCLDADDKYHSDFLAKTVAVLDLDHFEKIGFVTTWVTVFGEESQVWRTLRYNTPRLALENIVHVASLFRKKCWEKIGGYALNLREGYEDWNFWISIVASGYTWDCVEETLFYYRKRKHSMVSSSDMVRDRLFSTIVENNKAFYEQHLKEILLEATSNWVKANKELTDVRRQLDETKMQLNDITTSIGWRVTAKIETLIDKAFPAGTFRRRLLAYTGKQLSEARRTSSVVR
jgi:glycosyltransferase involved in cell wall biosynthesis